MISIVYILSEIIRRLCDRILLSCVKETRYSSWVKANTESRESEEQGSSTTSPSEGRHADGTSGSSVLVMGSTDSAGSAHSGGPSCGLVSSLFPSSCRGRAEAFARRLHRRLTSLGSEDVSQRNKDPTNPKETSWLRSSSTTKPMVNNASTNHVLQHQPRHNPDTELCYDFDLDFEDGLSSPAEEATAAEMADLVVNPEVLKNHRDLRHGSPNGSKTMYSSLDSESGYVYASPLMERSPDSDSSDIYFDPESSDVEKAKNEVYFDPVTTSDSEMTTSNLSNGCEPTKMKNVSYRRRQETKMEQSEDTSESTSSIPRNSFSNEESQNNELICNSKDSNERSSLETTSLSHESLWSTFDESTMSLQDESPSRISSGLTAFPNRLPKSHSDSEIPTHGPMLVISCELDRRDKVDQGVDEVDFVNGLSENGKLENIKNVRNLEMKEESTDSSENTTEEELPYDEEKPSVSLVQQNNLSLKVEENAVETGNGSTYSSMISIPGALTLEYPTGERVIEATVKNEVQLQIENGSVANSSDEDKMCLLLKKLTTDSTADDVQEATQEPQGNIEEEEEEEGERPQKIRRSSSLKTGKTPPGTPGRKKIVRFADVLGLDLADVRTFLDEIPKIPNSAYSDLIYDDIFQKDSSPVTSIPNIWGDRYTDSRRGSTYSLPSRKLDRTLMPLFQQPGGLPNFLELVRERRVCLENVLVQDPISMCIQGTVRVINLDFHKSVHIRYTLNSWRNFSDLQAIYVPNSCDGFSDKFSFVLYCHTLPVGQRLEFAVRFQCKGEQYWDNNAGANYCFQCLPASSAIDYIPITAQENQHHEWSPMFY
ncbi:glycogen-binding subunit 76A isoform X1 [Osmia bicornis bicornis]|uniref:glycogen-binding subunit 76A isoform X1 n=1 Tax=Osmia bicornis bicornis TaxID=1437191 RepID=UPI001EAF3E17|nr:glycogen-binding subunit 76A isoform X1 [Osmia bicornis bicornis]